MVLLQLPQELLDAVLAHLEVDGLRAVSSSCRQLRRMRWPVVNLSTAKLRGEWWTSLPPKEAGEHGGATAAGAAFHPLDPLENVAGV